MKFKRRRCLLHPQHPIDDLLISILIFCGMSRPKNTSKFSNLEEYLTHILIRLVQAENEFEMIRLLNSVFDNFPSD